MDKRNPACVDMQKLLTTFEGQSDLRGKVRDYVINNSAIPDKEKSEVFLQILTRDKLTEQDFEFLFTNRGWATPTINHLLDFANSGHLLEGYISGFVPDGAGGRTRGAKFPKENRELWTR